MERHRRARRQRAMRADHQAMRVEERQREQQMIVRRPLPRLAQRGDIRDQVAVEEHRALAAPRRAGGIGDHREIVGPGEIRRVIPAGRQERCPVSSSTLTTDSRSGRSARTRSSSARSLAVGDAEPDARITEDVAEFDLPVLRIDEHDYATRQPDAEIGGEEIRAVLQEKRDPVARRDAPRTQRAREGFRPLPQPCI